MKLTVERDSFADALAYVMPRTKSGRSIPILGNVLLSAKDGLLTLTANDCEACSSAELSAEVDAAGAGTIDAARLQTLVSNSPSGSQVKIEMEESKATVRCGRGRFALVTMPAEDFPNSFSPEDSIELSLTGGQIGQIFKVPISCSGNEKSRAYFNGICLHRFDKSRLAAAATDGIKLMQVVLDLGDLTSDFPRIIVPQTACRDISGFVKAESVKVEISDRLIAVSADGRKFVSKLIDGTYPDYEKLIPHRDKAIVFKADDFKVMLRRLLAAHDPERAATVLLKWDKSPKKIDVRAGSQFGEAIDEIDCDSDARDAGEIAFQIDHLLTLVESLGDERVTMFIAGPGDIVRIENPADKSLTSVLMPCRF